MATHTKNIVLTDLQQQLLSNDLYNDTDNAGIDTWIQGAVTGQINRSWKKFQEIIGLGFYLMTLHILMASQVISQILLL